MTAKATGRALSVLMQGVNNKVKSKQQYWRVAIRRLNANILRLVEIYVPNAKELIQGYYLTDIFFPAVLIRNVTEEIKHSNVIHLDRANKTTIEIASIGNKKGIPHLKGWAV